MATSGKQQREITRVSKQIINLIFDRKFDQAKAMIEAASQTISPLEAHRLIALTALLKRETGNFAEGIRLMRQAREASPNWLPHLFRLSVYLMDAKRWSDADVVLDELVTLSERNNDQYFVGEARLRRIICLAKLGRHEGIPHLRARTPPDIAVFIGDKYYRLEDLD